MKMGKKERANELEEYVREALSAIKAGVGADGSQIEGTIDFDVAVTSSKEGSAGFAIHVVTLGSNIKRERVTHLSFKVRPSITRKKISDIVKKAKSK